MTNKNTANRPSQSDQQYVRKADGTKAINVAYTGKNNNNSAQGNKTSHEDIYDKENKKDVREAPSPITPRVFEGKLSTMSKRELKKNSLKDNGDGTFTYKPGPFSKGNPRIQIDGAKITKATLNEDGLLHNDNGPAAVCDNPGGKCNYYMKNGKKHCDDGPAVERRNISDLSLREYWKDGKLVNLGAGGCAISKELPNVDGKSRYEYTHVNDEGDVDYVKNTVYKATGSGSESIDTWADGTKKSENVRESDPNSKYVQSATKEWGRDGKLVSDMEYSRTSDGGEMFKNNLAGEDWRLPANSVYNRRSSRLRMM